MVIKVTIFVFHLAVKCPVGRSYKKQKAGGCWWSPSTPPQDPSEHVHNHMALLSQELSSHPLVEIEVAGEAICLASGNKETLPPLVTEFGSAEQ